MAGVIHSESETWPWWIWGILIGAMCAAAWAVVGDTVADGGGIKALSVGQILGTAALSLGGPLVTWGLFGELHLEVSTTEVRASFGKLELFRKVVPLEDIRRVEAVRYSPLAEFGGWGIRIRPGRRAWTIRGDQAVRITPVDGPTIYLGTPNPQRLKERIELAMIRHRTARNPADTRPPE